MAQDKNLPGIIEKAATKQPFRVLAIGTGTGQPFDEELLNMLCASQKSVVYTVVEPSQNSVKKFKEFVKEKYSSVEFEWFCMSWEDFQDKEWKGDTGDSSQYNLIHLIHSLYYISSSVDELRDRIRRCCAEMLIAGGAMVVLADDSTGKYCFASMGNLDRKFWWMFGVNVVLEVASSEGWKVDAQEEYFKVDLSKCFDEDSVEGNLLLDFLTLIKDVRLKTPKEEMVALLKHLEEKTDGEGKIVYPCILDCTTVWKEVP